MNYFQSQFSNNGLEELFTNTLPQMEIFVRFFNTSPSISSIDVYIDDNLAFRKIEYKEYSIYVPLITGEHKISIFLSGDDKLPIVSKIIELSPHSIYTIAIINKFNILDITPIIDGNKSYSFGTAFFRFIHLSPEAPLLNLVNKKDKKLFKYIEFEESTGYLPLTPGKYNFTISSSTNNVIYLRVQPINLIANNFYTLYVVGLLNNYPKMETFLIKDGL